MTQFKQSFKCSVQWEDMTGEGSTRTCENCSKCVHDLRGKSDVEVSQLLLKSDVCGVIEANRIKPKNWWIRAAIGITSFLALQSFQLKAQLLSTVDAYKALDYSKQKHLLGGKVVDGVGRPVEDAEIVLKNIYNEVVAQAYTGKLGLFRFEIPYSEVHNDDLLTLKVSRYSMGVISKHTTMALMKKEELRFDLGYESHVVGAMPATRYRMMRAIRQPDVDFTEMRNIANRMSDVKLVSGGYMNN